ncbi:MAG: hypothetical protein KTR16_02860 [Acidiferrobacterales bacterium]|nr:hypothetical protein [Acidiferrobacterales bacterium]
MKRKLIIHIGYGKTGSSALQSWFANNQQALKGNGISYVGVNRDARNYRISSGNASLLLDYLGSNDVADEEVIEHYFSDMQIALISGEALQTLGAFGKQDSTKLLDLVHRYDLDLQLVAFIRNIYNHNYSNYVQAVKRKGFTMSFEEWFSERGNIYPVDFYLGLYELIPVNLLHYDEELEDLAAAFCGAVGIDYDTLSPMEARRVNRTLTHAEIEVLIGYIKMATSAGYQSEVFAKCVSDHIVNAYPDFPSEVFVSQRVVAEIDEKFGRSIDRFNSIATEKFGFKIEILNKYGYADVNTHSDLDRLSARSRVRSAIVRQLSTLSSGPVLKFFLTISLREPIFALKAFIRFVLYSRE